MATAAHNPGALALAIAGAIAVLGPAVLIEAGRRTRRRRRATAARCAAYCWLAAMLARLDAQCANPLL